VDEGDAGVDEGEVVAVSAVLLPTTNGTGGQRPTNTGGKGVVAALTENIAEAGHPPVAIVPREEEGDAGDMDRTPTTIMDDPLPTTALTHSPHPCRRTPHTQHHPSLLRHRTHSLSRPHLCLRLQ
jgi:hypothetical protein